MGKVYINKNGKTNLYELNTNYEEGNLTLPKRCLHYLGGKKLVFKEDYIQCGNYMYCYPNVESIEGTLNVETTAKYMFSSGSNNINVNESTTWSSGGSVNLLKNVDLNCSATNTVAMFEKNVNLENAKLVLQNSTNTNNTFYGCKKLKSAIIHAPQSTTFNFCFGGCDELESVIMDAPQSTTIRYCFSDCKNLESVDISNMTNLENYDGAFSGCLNLKNVLLPQIKRNSNLSSMFHSCRSLESVNLIFSNEQASSTNANFSNMFYQCYSLQSINADFEGMTDSTFVFYDCHSLRTFNANLASLTNGVRAFHRCELLTDFNGSLASLTSGVEMFLRCKLNLQSVTNIMNSMKTENNSATGTLTLGIDKNSKNEVRTYLANNGSIITSGTFDTDKSSTTTFVNAAGNVWNLEIYWN